MTEDVNIRLASRVQVWGLIAPKDSGALRTRAAVKSCRGSNRSCPHIHLVNITPEGLCLRGHRGVLGMFWDLGCGVHGLALGPKPAYAQSPC